MPETLRRSPEKAQRTYRKVKENAEKQYGPGETAARTAIAAVKHGFEKVGDHWEAKEKPGPSDPRSKLPTAEKRAGKGKTFGGVDVEGNSRHDLLERARELQIPGRSRMTKEELATAISKKQG
ncbi:MAG TPA: ChaB family protein [Azonexus sp.]|nr:ChaB family protein [Azonexus sp.]